MEQLQSDIESKKAFVESKETEIVALEQQVAQPKQIARGEHTAEVLSLSTAERDRLLRLREPVEQAAVVEDQAAAHGEARAPVGVDKSVEAARRAGAVHRARQGRPPGEDRADRQGAHGRRVRRGRAQRSSSRCAVRSDKIMRSGSRSEAEAACGGGLAGLPSGPYRGSNADPK